MLEDPWNWLFLCFVCENKFHLGHFFRQEWLPHCELNDYSFSVSLESQNTLSSTGNLWSFSDNESPLLWCILYKRSEVIGQWSVPAGMGHPGVRGFCPEQQSASLIPLSTLTILCWNLKWLSLNSERRARVIIEYNTES